MGDDSTSVEVGIGKFGLAPPVLADTTAVRAPARTQTKSPADRIRNFQKIGSDALKVYFAKILLDHARRVYEWEN